MRRKKLVLFLFCGLCFFLTTQTARADALFLVSLNTSALVGHAAGPFALNFQFSAGSGAANNLVTLSNFQFGGGSAAGAPMLTGGANGDLMTVVTLNDTSFINDFTQLFTPGSVLSFTLHVTTNMDTGGTPDQFSFAILDSGGNELPTLNSFFDVFIVLEIDSSNPLPMGFGSDPMRSPIAGGGPIDTGPPQLQQQTQVVPEPATLFLLSAGLAGCWACSRHYQNRVAAANPKRR